RSRPRLQHRMRKIRRLMLERAGGQIRLTCSALTLVAKSPFDSKTVAPERCFPIFERPPSGPEAHGAVADAIVEVALNLVLHARSPLASVLFGPKVLRRSG